MNQPGAKTSSRERRSYHTPSASLARIFVTVLMICAKHSEAPSIKLIERHAQPQRTFLLLLRLLWLSKLRGDGAVSLNLIFLWTKYQSVGSREMTYAVLGIHVVPVQRTLLVTRPDDHRGPHTNP
ncbi:hypothetical protein WAI453_009524 [Rhynchosporium graminicola]